MTTLPIYQVDAFTNRVFGGNPAAVMPLERWLSDQQLQQLALENNLSETAFIVPEPADSELDYHIRWFTPGAEVALCGHATLATAWVLFNRLGFDGERVSFRSLSGPLHVARKDDGWLTLDFPRLGYDAGPTPALLKQALPEAGDTTYFVSNDRNQMVILDSEEAVLNAQPDMRLLKQLDRQGVIVTARGRNSDFVSRYFVPAVGIDEDPVTGSIHCALTPYWAEQLGREKLTAHQLSARGGVLECELKGDRVEVSGQAAFYMEGQVQLPG